MDDTEILVITCLVLIVCLFLFQVEVYRNVLMLCDFYKPQIAPDPSLRFSDSFLSSAPKRKK